MSHPPEDDRTVLSSSARHPPTDGQGHRRPHALPIGTHLNEFEVTDILGEGGFGIVYLAYDSSLERQVAVKEYMPSFALRSTQAHVSVKSVENADSFEAGLRSFINEARMLAQFDHPSLVKVYRFWEANGTAYMVMPYYHGATLKQALHDRTSPPDEAWLKALLGSLLDALDVMHQHQCFHRDIAPDNILMLDEGRPLLLDFGAARRAISGMNQAFTVILKQNYAPIEQYAEMPGMSQGAWTDLYALASVVHFAIDGHPPPPALSRMISDPYVPLVSRYSDRYSPAFLQAIDQALSFRPENRPQSVFAMHCLLGLAPAAQHAHATPALTSASPAALAAPWPRNEDKARTRGRAMLAASAVAIALCAASLFAYTKHQGPRLAVHATSGTPGAGPGKPAAIPGSALPVFAPTAALDSIRAGATLDRKVTVQVGSPRVRIGLDKLSFSVQSSHAGYVYIFLVGTEGNDFHLLFPNASDGENRIAARESMSLPRRSWPIRAFGPPGTDHFVVMVSDARRNFSGAGLDDDKPIRSFPLARAARLQAAYTGETPLFAGVPECAATPCPANYGAAAFTIEEVTK